MRRFSVLAILGFSFALMGCSAAAPDTNPSGAPATSTSSDAPASEPATIDITEKNLYDVCIDKVTESGHLASGDESNVTFAPEDDAVTVTRDDGYIGIYLLVTDGNNAFSAESAISCVAKGPSLDPQWYWYGVETPYAIDAEATESLRVEYQK
jgi:hypothetical protein